MSASSTVEAIRDALADSRNALSIAADGAEHLHTQLVAATAEVEQLRKIRGLTMAKTAELQCIAALAVDDPDLLKTVATWADRDGSMYNAAVALWCHENTIRYRLNKFTALTGLDLTKPRDIAVAIPAVDAALAGSEVTV